MQNRGKRIWKELLNPMSEYIALSELLLLLVLKEFEKGAFQKQIEQGIKTKWKAINNKKPDFFIVWSRGYDLHNEIMRFTEIGMIDIEDWKNNEPLWKLTSKGEEALEKWKDECKKYLDPISNSV